MPKGSAPKGYDVKNAKKPKKSPVPPIKGVSTMPGVKAEYWGRKYKHLDK